VNGIYAAHPGIIHHPKHIAEVTYKEMRELAYAGFTVFHDEALYPCYEAGIPVVIKNTNNPDHIGTTITSKHTDILRPVVGIAADDGFCSLNIDKYLLNKEIGFARKLLSVLEDNHVSFEHMPSGIDDISIIMRERYLTPELEEKIIAEITELVHPDEVYFEHDLSLLMIVGEAMKEHIGVMSRGTFALAAAGVNLDMINQGSSEVSIVFSVKNSDAKKAVRALYAAYF
jgi:aspartate kinase